MLESFLTLPFLYLRGKEEECVVILATAETTTTGFFGSAACMIDAACVIAAALPTEVPPNFITCINATITSYL